MQKGVGHQAHQLYLVHRVFLDSAGRRICRPSMLASENRHPATKDDYDAHPCTVWQRAHGRMTLGVRGLRHNPPLGRERLPDAGGVVRERLRIRAFHPGAAAVLVVNLREPGIGGGGEAGVSIRHQLSNNNLVGTTASGRRRVAAGGLRGPGGKLAPFPSVTCSAVSHVG